MESVMVSTQRWLCKIARSGRSPRFARSQWKISIGQDLKDASEPYRKMVMETIDKARVTFGGLIPAFPVAFCPPKKAKAALVKDI
jgi:hypothetical protein